MLQVLEGENAVAKNRDIMGATNPANAAPGTIRKEFAENIERNSVHGSDSAENAALEIGLVFAESEISGDPTPCHGSAWPGHFPREVTILEVRPIAGQVQP